MALMQAGQGLITYTYNAAAGAVTLKGVGSFTLERLAVIQNVTRGEEMFTSGITVVTVTVATNEATITFAAPFAGHQDTDKLRVIYNTATEAMPIKGVNTAFRDNFIGGAAANWNILWENQGTSVLEPAGTDAGSKYLMLSPCPFNNTSLSLTSRQRFAIPAKWMILVSQSQRVLGQEFEAGIVETDEDGAVINEATVAPLAISGTVSVTTNVATINFAAPHGLHVNDRVFLKGNAEPRLNVGPVLVTVTSLTQITVPLTLANGTYTAGGVVEYRPHLAGARNAAGFVFDNATVTQAQVVSNRNGSTEFVTTQTIPTVTASQITTANYAQAFAPACALVGISAAMDWQWGAFVPNSTVAIPTNGRYNSPVPDEEGFYSIRLRMRNDERMTRPVATIATIAKTGTTTATVTTTAPHGLTATSRVQIQGVRDIVNFPALAETQVASIVSPTVFTIVIGTATTSSSTGGMVVLVQGSTAMVGATGLSVQSIQRTNNELTVTMNTTAAGALPGELWHLYGTLQAGIDGAYKVLRQVGTTYLLESVGANIGLTNCGGVLFKRTEHRVHAASMWDFNRLVTSLEFQGANDPSRSMPVLTATGSTISSVTACTTVSAVTSVTSANVGIPLGVADVASAALTTTTTTAAIAPASGQGSTVQVAVTAVTGTNPTLDFSVEESTDVGTTWRKVYDFPRITTAPTTLVSPPLALRGNRLRYVQTVGGTTPSFTRSVYRLQDNGTTAPVNQLIDRTIVLTTLNSVTPALQAGNTSRAQLVVVIGTAATPPQLQLEGSEDGTNWYALGSPLAAVASSTVMSNVVNTHSAFLRARVSVAGATVVAGYVCIKGF